MEDFKGAVVTCFFRTNGRGVSSKLTGIKARGSLSSNHWKGGHKKDIAFSIILLFFTATRTFLKTEGSNKKGFSIVDVGNKKKVVIRTSDKNWELLFTPSLSTWIHVCITWSPANGLRYYENGRLTASSDKYTHATNTLVGTSMHLGIIPGETTTDVVVYMKHLGLWFKELQPQVVQDVYNYGKPIVVLYLYNLSADLSLTNRATQRPIYN